MTRGHNAERTFIGAGYACSRTASGMYDVCKTCSSTHEHPPHASHPCLHAGLGIPGFHALALARVHRVPRETGQWLRQLSAYLCVHLVCLCARMALRSSASLGLATRLLNGSLANAVPAAVGQAASWSFTAGVQGEMPFLSVRWPWPEPIPRPRTVCCHTQGRPIWDVAMSYGSPALIS